MAAKRKSKIRRHKSNKPLPSTVHVTFKGWQIYGVGNIRDLQELIDQLKS